MEYSFSEREHTSKENLTERQEVTPEPLQESTPSNNQIDQIVLPDTLPEFDPDFEVHQILKHKSGEARVQALNEFKQKFADQLTALAQTQDDLVSTVLEDPEISPEELDLKIEKYSDRYGFSPAQIARMRETADKFHNRHELVREVQQQYENEADLCMGLLGFEPQGEIEVIEGPISLHIRFHDFHDFSSACNHHNPNHVENPGDHSMNHFESVLGVSLPNVVAPGLVTIENTSRLGTLSGSDLLEHETQHSFDDLLHDRGQHFKGEKWIKLRDLSYKAQLSPEDAYGYARECKAEVFDLCRDEFLSKIRGDESLGDTALALIVAYIPKYLALVETRFSAFSPLFDKYNQANGLLLQAYRDEFSGLEQILIDCTLSALKSCLNLQDQGWGRDQGISLLMSVPYENWPKVVNDVTYRKQHPNLLGSVEPIHHDN